MRGLGKVFLTALGLLVLWWVLSPPRPPDVAPPDPHIDMLEALEDAWASVDPQPPLLQPTEHAPTPWPGKDQGR